MANISNFKRVQVLIKEKTSNKTILTIIAFLFSILILISSLSNDGNTNYLRVVQKIIRKRILSCW